VYRAPLLVAIPLISIAVALVASTNLVAWLAGLAELPALGQWWSFKVFTTTKIFIVVILFGAGTDFCLFLIARYREELAKGDGPEAATARALAAVGDALAASALTTIVGLSLMFFSEFGKFRYSGPVIGLCLTVALLVCVTLTPALLRACGGWVFWPYGPRGLVDGVPQRRWSHALWDWTARQVVRRPGLILSASIVCMLPLATYGIQRADHVTYDILSSLDESRPSRQGADTLRRHFPVGESGPLTVVLFKPGADFRSEDGRKAIYDLAQQMYAVDGVSVVRSLVDPLGDFPPGERIGFWDRRDWTTWLSRPHRKTEAVFVAQTAEYRGDLTRMDIVFHHDPFSREAIDSLRRLDRALRSVAADAASFWSDCQIAYAGPTAAVRDLREVTLGDRKRIEVLVVLGVYVALVVILRRPLVCLYLVLSVLFTYFVTIGLTELFFSFAYGDSYMGLDWKVPLFLFVILVAVGQDYNVYLATRVFEEQDRHGPFGGLRQAVIQTGGIITSCGVIMAGSFLAMTSVAWGGAVPESWTWLRGVLGTGGGLRSMVELGFALAVGVLIDTLVVRPVLVPSFLALISRWKAKWGQRTDLAEYGVLSRR
jgi:RND superfamily putative drug exporter